MDALSGCLPLYVLFWNTVTDYAIYTYNESSHEATQDQGENLLERTDLVTKDRTY